jgi:RNA polymerase sigma-70 factor (ECF subfamily)
VNLRESPITVSQQSASVDVSSLLRRARGGEAAAFESLVRMYQGSVYSIGYRMFSRRDVAEDLAQDVFLQLYRKLDSIESLEHLGFWLRRVASNLAIDWLRRASHSATQPLEDGAEIPEQPKDDDPLLNRQLSRLLGELTPAARAVMLLRYQEDCDVAEIAEALDMPVNTVKSHIKRSLTALRGKMIGARLITAEELS